MTYKIESETIHTIEVHNQKGIATTLSIDVSDVTVLNSISHIFKVFDGLKNIKLDVKASLDEVVEVTQKLSDEFVKVNTLIDATFGAKTTEKVFRGSHSVSLYEKFFNMLDKELEKAGAKVETYINKTKAKYAPQDHKRKSKKVI